MQVLVLLKILTNMLLAAPVTQSNSDATEIKQW
jgi:hypothetical protein